MLISRLTAGGPASPTASDAALPEHGALLLDLDLSPAGGRRLVVTLGDTLKDAVRYLGSAVEISVSAGSRVSLTVLDVAPDDFVAEYAVSVQSGEGTYSFWFRGSQSRQIQLQLSPQSGELLIQIAQPLLPAASPQVLFGPASRLAPAGVGGAAQRLVVAAHGRDVIAYQAARELAKGSDPLPVAGAIGLTVTAARDRPLVVRLTSLRLYAP
jgi:hypothetical protein